MKDSRERGSTLKRGLLWVLVLALVLVLAAHTWSLTYSWGRLLAVLTAVGALGSMVWRYTPWGEYWREVGKKRAEQRFLSASAFPFQVYGAGDLEELKRTRVERGWRVPYQTRESAGAGRRFRDALRTHRLILVTGRSGVGKTRECLEFIESLHEDGEDVVVLYAERGFDRPGPRGVPATFGPRHVVLLIEDVDKHFNDHDSLLGIRPFPARLRSTIEWMNEEYRGRDWRVIVVAREEPTIADAGALVGDWWSEFHKVQLRRIHKSRAAEFVTNVAGFFSLELAPGAVKFAASSFDGTPASIITVFDRLARTGPRPPGPIKKQDLTRQGVRFVYPSDWEEREYLESIHPIPARRVVFESLSVLLQLGFPTYEFLAVDLAARLLGGRSPVWWRRRKVRAALPALSAYVFDSRGSLICEKAYLRGRRSATSASMEVVESIRWSLRHPSLRGALLPHLPAVALGLEVRLGLRDAALELFNLERDDGEGASVILGIRSALLSRDGRRELSRAVAEQAVARGKDNAHAHVVLSAVTLELGDFEAAETAAQRAIRIDPRSDAAWTRLGICLSRQGKETEGIAALEHAVELNPFNSVALSALGIAYERAGRLQDAVSTCMRAVQADPSAGQAWHTLGIARSVAGDVPGALEALRQARVVEPDLTKVLLTMVKVLSDVPAGDQAAKQREVLAICRDLQRRATGAEGWSDAATAWGIAREPANAVRAALRALELEPSYAPAAHSLFVDLQRLAPDERREYGPAVLRVCDVVERRLTKVGGSAEDWNLLAVTLRGMRYYDRAARGFEKALRIDPDNVRAAWNLVLLAKQLTEEGRLAISDLLEVARLALSQNVRWDDDDSAHDLYKLATAARVTERPDEAIAAAQVALARDPEHRGAAWSLIIDSLSITPAARRELRADVRAACEVLQKHAANDEKPDPDEWARVASAWGMSGSPAEAADAARVALRADPRHRAASWSLVINATRLPAARWGAFGDEIRSACENLEWHAAGRMGATGREWYEVASAWLQVGMTERALPAAQKALELEPDHLGAHRVRVQGVLEQPTRVQKERVADLWTSLEAMERLAATPAEYAQVSDALRRVGEHERALSAARRAAELEPNGYAVRRVLAMALQKAGSREEMLDAWQGLGVGQGIREAEREVDRSPSEVAAWKTFALECLSAGTPDVAIRKALGYVTGRPPPFSGVVAVASELANVEPDAVENILVEMIRREEGVGEYHHLLGVCLSRSGRITEAIEQQLMACSLQPKVHRYRYALGRVYERASAMAVGQDAMVANDAALAAYAVASELGSARAEFRRWKLVREGG